MQFQSLQIPGLDLGLLQEFWGCGCWFVIFSETISIFFFFKGYYLSLAISILKPINVQGLALFVTASLKQ